MPQVFLFRTQLFDEIVSSKICISVPLHRHRQSALDHVLRTYACEVKLVCDPLQAAVSILIGTRTRCSLGFSASKSESRVHQVDVHEAASHNSLNSLWRIGGHLKMKSANLGQIISCKGVIYGSDSVPRILGCKQHGLGTHLNVNHGNPFAWVAHASRASTRPEVGNSPGVISFEGCLFRFEQHALPCIKYVHSSAPRPPF